MKLNIMGTEYDVVQKTREEETFFRNNEACDGYCDCTSYTIAIRIPDASDSMDNATEHMKRVMRHEIIHAFLFESGLGAEIPPEQGQSELYVDWFARQYRKIYKAFEDADCM